MHKGMSIGYSNAWVFNLLWQAATSIIVGWFGPPHAEITISSISNRLNYCVILWRIHNSEIWLRAAYYNVEGRGLETHAVIMEYS